MSLLTPLFALGALAVALPVLFHLLRRAPSKRQTFSSLMFLSPTPPRFTRRSRISNWLLLLLRAAVLTLLALAFARPFLRQDVAVAAGGPAGRHVALLVDISASMRRGDLWEQAKRHAEDVIARLGPADELSLSFFDRQVRPVLSFEQWNRLDPAQRAAAARAELAAASPTWQGTAIGDAVARVAEQLAAGDDAKSPRAPGPRTVVLISDLQQGGRPEALQGRVWPESVRLDVRPVVARDTTNAGLQAVRPSADAPDADDRPRVRVANAAGSAVEQFTLVWADGNGPLTGVKPQAVYVPAGRGQVVRVDWPKDPRADRVRLTGDAADFDNTLYVVRPRQQTVRVVYAGDDAADDPKALAFYLRTALGDTPQRRVDLTLRSGDTLAAADLAGAGLLVVGRPLTDPAAAIVRQYAEAGGDVLWVLRSAVDAAGLARVAGADGIDVAEPPGGNFALLARVDTTRPLLAAFADARFGDFSRVHFWKHRRVTLPTNTGTATLAAFDDGDPFLIEKPVGRGRVLLMTSGWQPADSQLALSSKFVPILDGLLRPTGGDLPAGPFAVGDTLATPSPTTSTTQPSWTLAPPGGPAAPLPAGAADPFDRPGVYTLTAGDRRAELAVNLRPDESRTAPITPDDFKQWGVKLDAATAGEGSGQPADDGRQAKAAELENRQKLWQWLLAGVLGLVAAETALAGRLARRGGPRSQVSPG